MNSPAIAASGPATGSEAEPMEIGIDRERCIGAGMCVLIAPEVFDQGDEDGRVLLLDSAPPDAHHPAAREAAHSCPAAAITLLGR